MLKKIFIFLAFLAALHAQNKTNEYINILGKNIISENNITTATDRVLIFSPTYYITTDKAIYDMNKRTLELIGNVNIVQKNDSHSMSEYAFVDLNKETLFEEPIFLINYTDSLWMASKNLKSDANETNFECTTTLSSCDSDDPFWSAKFSSGFQDKQNQWIHTFNTRLYIKSIPFFYSPYFGFPTDKTRRSGLLRPTIGYSKEEGFLYAQPIYFAPQHNWDLELIPQTRGHRGQGMYGYFRFADSPYSMLQMKSGQFIEQSSFKEENRLQNDKHFGWDLDYKRTKLFSNDETQDGLFSSLHYLNDIDYKNLEQVNKTLDYEKNIESKLNYFYKTQNLYFGTYFRYYQDSSKENNDATMQQLPVGHLHKFSDSIIFDKLVYSADLKYENYSRKKDINGEIYNFSMPISYSFSLLDDYLNLSFKENIQATKLDYSNTDSNFDNGSMFQSTHIISASTELVKPYTSIIHSVGLDLTYSIPDKEKISGDIYGVNSQIAELSPFNQTLSKNKELSFGLNQSFYNKQTIAQILNHKLKQSITIDETGKSRRQNLDNEISIYYGLGSLSNRFLFNHEDNKIIEYSSSLDIAKNGVYAKINHYGTNLTPNSNKTDTEFLSVDTGFNFKRFYTFSYKQSYDLYREISNKQEYKFAINKRCWGLGLRYEDSLVASSSYDTYRQKMIYLMLELKPLGGFEQKYGINSKQ